MPKGLFTADELTRMAWVSHWSLLPPQDSGWFWLKRPGNPPEAVQVAIVPSSPFPLNVRLSGRELAEPLALMPCAPEYLWCGPILPPVGWEEINITMRRPGQYGVGWIGASDPAMMPPLPRQAPNPFAAYLPQWADRNAADSIQADAIEPDADAPIVVGDGPQA